MAITGQNSAIKNIQLSRFLTNIKNWVHSVLNPVEQHASAEIEIKAVASGQTPASTTFDTTTKKFMAFPVGGGNLCASDGTPLPGKVYTHAGKAYVWNGTDLIDVSKSTWGEVTGKPGRITKSELDTGTSTSERMAEPKAIADYVKGAISNKANKATTLSGYGITDAYTKSEVNAKLTSVYKPQGSSAFASLPTLDAAHEGFVYNVTDAFSTTASFAEGAGKAYPAGTNVVCIKIGSDYKWDALSGNVDLSGLANKTHTHAIADVTNLQSTLNGKASTSHNQASNTINAMTGYAKASSVAAISTSDSLNTAVGKLEKALDAKAASSHNHEISQVNGLQTALNGKQATITWATDADIDSLFT